jgi:hypothetical protein
MEAPPPTTYTAQHGRSAGCGVTVVAVIQRCIITARLPGGKTLDKLRPKQQ